MKYIHKLLALHKEITSKIYLTSGGMNIGSTWHDGGNLMGIHGSRSVQLNIEQAHELYKFLYQHYGEEGGVDVRIK